MDVTPPVATIVAAFADDPVERWLYPEEAAYLEHFPRFVTAFAGEAVVSSAEDFAAVAMWLPPGVEPDGDAITTVLAGTVDPAKHEDTFAVAEQMDAAHPRFAHWYLPWLAVRAGASRRRPRRRAPARRARPRGRRPAPDLPRDAQPAHDPALRAPRVRGHRGRSGGRVPARHLHAQNSPNNSCRRMSSTATTASEAPARSRQLGPDRRSWNAIGRGAM